MRIQIMDPLWIHYICMRIQIMDPLWIHFICMRIQIMDPLWKKWTRNRIKNVKYFFKIYSFFNKLKTVFFYFYAKHDESFRYYEVFNNLSFVNRAELLFWKGKLFSFDCYFTLQIRRFLRIRIRIQKVEMLRILNLSTSFTLKRCYFSQRSL